jgi:carboxypeptidase PM20D1
LALTVFYINGPEVTPLYYRFYCWVTWTSFPVEPGTTSQWEHGPFSGVVQDGFVWGRGAIDNKSAVVGTLEAVEMLLTDKFQPIRTVYLAFGHDEEVGGNRGAQKIAELLRRRGVQFEMILDEGGVVADGILPDVKVPTAMMGVAEKGFANVELKARGAGGHSSLPSRESAIGILSRAIVRVEQNQMPPRLEGAPKEMFNRITPQFPFMKRVAFANLWLTRPLVLRKLQSISTTNAMIRTTTAVTVFQAGMKENALPTEARAVINFRILRGDSVSDVLRHVRTVIADPRIEMKLAGGFSAEASATSNADGPSFKTLERTIRSLAPTWIVAPYLVVVVTDSRHYADLSRNVFRFLPVRLQAEDVPRLHGLNERIAIRDYEWAIKFYRQLILNMTGA